MAQFNGRIINIQSHAGSWDCLISHDLAKTLIESGAVYECGDGHDLHLTPDHDFTLEEVETLTRTYMIRYQPPVIQPPPPANPV